MHPPKPRRERFSFPGTEVDCFGRGFSAAWTEAGVWAATTFEHRPHRGILIHGGHGSNSRNLEIKTAGHPFMPCLASDGGGGLILAWTENTAGRWRGCCAEKPAKAGEFGPTSADCAIGLICNL